MPSALASLLHRSLDFAGLFPPASLPVAEALSLYRKERAADSAGLIARFVCPVLKLEELTAAGAGGIQPFEISVLPRGGRNAGEFLANFETDLAVIRRLSQLHGNAVAIDTLELRPPADALAPTPLRKLLAGIHALLGRQSGGIRQAFVELAPAPTLASQLELLAELSGQAASGSPIVGYKLRTGGSDAAAAPSSAQTAAALAAVAALGLPMKCTGGLHRPLRSAGPAGPMHGFVNLLLAATLAAGRATEPGLLEAVLEETDPAAFTFDGRTLGWRDRQAKATDVATARRQLLVSFGSCYVEQPRLELQKLGWWPKPARPRSAAV